MKRRLLFFGFGALISIFFLSMGPENRLKDTFYAYMDYFDMDKRVITHLYPNTTDTDATHPLAAASTAISSVDAIEVLSLADLCGECQQLHRHHMRLRDSSLAASGPSPIHGPT